IVGPSGSGKSHLANAMAQRLAKSMQDGQALRVSAAQWAASLAEGNAPVEPELIVVDDVGGHLDAREQQTLAEWLDRTNSVVLLAGNESILADDVLEPGFRSRATAALIVHVNAPDMATARILLQRNSAAMDLNLDDELLGVIAER